jgi:predicted dehydrogenase
MKLKVGLIGLGRLGKVYARDLSSRLAETRLVAVADVNGALAAEVAAEFDVPRSYGDPRELLTDPDVDAVVIVSPTHTHKDVVCAAMESRKPTFCEKPLALSLDEARRMADAARDVATLVWFNYRRVPAIAFARELIADGRLGRVFHYNASYKQQWGADPTRLPSWKMDPSLAGSGVGDDLLTHLIDAALYLNGPMSRVVATTRTFAPNRSVDDAVVAMVEFGNGSIGTFEATRFGIGCKNCNAFEVHAEKGMLRFNLERLNHLEFLDATEPSTEQGLRDLLVTDMKHPVFPNFWRPGHIIGYEHTFIAAFAEFLQCLSKSEEFHPNFNDGVAVQQVLDAVQRSAKTGQWTTV